MKRCHVAAFHGPRAADVVGQFQPTSSVNLRRPLWMLDPTARRAVIDLCLPVATLRHLFAHAGGLPMAADVRALHGAALMASGQRTSRAERLQAALDARHAVALRQADALCTAAALADWWQAQATGHKRPGALWAVLTHPRCTPAMARDLLAALHGQHQAVPAALAAEAPPLTTLADENAVLARHLAAAQGRAARRALDDRQAIEALERQVVRLRAEVIRHITALHLLQRDGPPGRSRVSCWPPRTARMVVYVGPVPAHGPADMTDPAETGAPSRSHRCREVDVDAVWPWDGPLAAADLVICQTGCLSHGAYWRVKAYCRRTGKPCLLVDNLSRWPVSRALARISATTAVSTASDEESE